MPGRVGGSGTTITSLPTPGVFGQTTILHGKGTEADPFLVLYAAEQLNFNTNTVTMNITFPGDPSGICRLKYLSAYCAAAAAGVYVSPYAQVLSTNLGTQATFPIGASQLTTQVTDFLTWPEVDGIQFATLSGIVGSLSTQTPFRLYFSSYAATDDVDIMLLFEWWC